MLEFTKTIIADDEKSRKIGVRDNLDAKTAMILVFPKFGYQNITMKNTKIPLTISFLDENKKVLKVYDGKPLSKESYYGFAKYVVETNPKDFKIKEGDTLKFLILPEDTNSRMLVLDEDGDTQMIIEGGERIFSRPHTKTLVSMVKKAKNDEDFKKIGSKMLEIINIQNTQKREYVHE